MHSKNVNFSIIKSVITYKYTIFFLIDICSRQSEINRIINHIVIFLIIFASMDEELIEIREGRKILGFLVNNQGKKEIIICPLHRIQKPGYAPFYLLFSNDGKLVKEAYWYLNTFLREDSNCAVNTIAQAAEALRFLYFFFAIKNITAPLLLNKDWLRLQSFLLQTRGQSSVDVYLSTYRNYFRELKLRVPSGKSNKSGGRSYHDTTKPKTLSDDDFGRIVELAYQKKDYTTIVVLFLLRVYGIRKGWCLSLTIEDIGTTVISGQEWGVLYFGNRLSAGPEEQVKMHISPKSKEDYKTKAYQDEYNLSKTLITMDTYHLLMWYIESIHAIAISQHPKNYYSHPADSVTGRLDEGDNHSVFLSSIGTPLSGRTFTNVVRSYCKELEIPIDYGSKKNGLCHRIRHQFGTEKIMLGYDRIKVSRMMKQRSPFSVDAYFNPSEEVIAEEVRKNVEYTNSRLPNLNHYIDEILHRKDSE